MTKKKKLPASTDDAPHTTSDEICHQAFCLFEKRNTAIRLAQGERKWMESSLKRLTEAAADDVHWAANEALELARHASALAVLFAQIDCMNVAVKSLDKVAVTHGIDLTDEMHEIGYATFVVTAIGRV